MFPCYGGTSFPHVHRFPRGAGNRAGPTRSQLLPPTGRAADRHLAGTPRVDSDRLLPRRRVAPGRDPRAPGRRRIRSVDRADPRSTPQRTLPTRGQLPARRRARPDRPQGPRDLAAPEGEPDRGVRRPGRPDARAASARHAGLRRGHSHQRSGACARPGAGGRSVRARRGKHRRGPPRGSAQRRRAPARAPTRRLPGLHSEGCSARRSRSLRRSRSRLHRHEGTRRADRQSGPGGARLCATRQLLRRPEGVRRSGEAVRRLPRALPRPPHADAVGDQLLQRDRQARARNCDLDQGRR